MERTTQERLIDWTKKNYSSQQRAFAERLATRVGEILGPGEATTAAYALPLFETSGPEGELREILGNELSEKVALLSRLGRVAYPETGKKLNDLRRLFLELTDDVSLILIKLAERVEAIHEAELSSSPDLKRQAEEALALYAPIAQRLGISRLSIPLEDSGFKNLFPKEFHRLEYALDRQRPLWEAKLRDTGKILKDTLSKEGLQIVSLQGRVKRLYSIFRKIRNKGVSLEEIFDLLALRVITSSPPECYLALGIIHSHWTPIEGRFRDWIAYPKANGYRSIQTTILSRNGDRYEIQIRTEEMHREAEYGAAAHWSYKEGGKASRESWINRLKEFLENDEFFYDPSALKEILKEEMKRDFINVLTPKGHILSLPEGSCPVDFAYGIHTELGHKTVGSRVNGKLVPLSTPLKSGDVVEILSSTKAKPSQDWLNFVKSSRGRSKIREWFRQNQKEAFLAEGKKRWESILRRYQKRLKGLPEEPEKGFRERVKNAGYGNDIDAFFLSLASGALGSGLQVLKRLFPEVTAPKKSPPVAQTAQRLRTPEVIVQGVSGLEVHLARCCLPLRGEGIVAYITKTRGISIHASRCPLIKREVDASRFREALWAEGTSLQEVPAIFYGEEAQPIITSLINLASEEKIGVKALHQRGTFPEISVEIILQLENLEQLKRFLHRAEGLPPIRGVYTPALP
ncbi:MAG TPA: TGS domain-containing protein [Candidatus Aminicenantes bacterium]|nr:TGS domain-containing protein [Candidatus Aminicenantes bacterium]